MIDDIKFSKFKELTQSFKIKKDEVIAGFEKIDFVLLLKVYKPTEKDPYELGFCCSNLCNRASEAL